MSEKNNIHFFFENIEKFTLRKDECREWILKIIKSEGENPGFLNIIFTDDQSLLNLNKKFLNHSDYTDIITFDYTSDNEGNISGDIFISTERAKENAAIHNQLQEIETLRLIAHGILHLLGYEDNSERLKKNMESKENQYLEDLSNNSLPIRY